MICMLSEYIVQWVSLSKRVFCGGGRAGALSEFFVVHTLSLVYGEHHIYAEHHIVCLLYGERHILSLICYLVVARNIPFEIKLIYLFSIVANIRFFTLWRDNSQRLKEN